MLSSFLRKISLTQSKSIGDRGLLALTANKNDSRQSLLTKQSVLAPSEKLFPISIKLLTIAFISFALIGCGEKNSENEGGEGEIKSNIIAVSAADFHSLALSKDGKVYATGRNKNGQLGLSDSVYVTNRRETFVAVASLSGKNIIAVSAGLSYSLALSKDGKVYGAGANGLGQLGLGDNDKRKTFTEVTSLSGKNIIAVIAGGNHSFALSKDGKVYATGHSNNGQLGLGDSGYGTNRKTFTEVTSLSGKNIIAVSAGLEHSFALSKDGKVYATGFNSFGQLGLGDSGRGTNRETFVEVASLSGKNIIAVIAGGNHSFALSKDGRVYATGINFFGQLGLGGADKRTFVEVKSLSGKTLSP